MHFLVTVAVLVAAPPSGGAAARRGEATAALEAAERARGADVVEGAAALVAAGWTAESNLAFFAHGAQLVSDGRRALARVELDKAEALFAEAEDLYRGEAARAGVAAEWAEAAKWHGVALFELKRPGEAARAWGLCKRLEPASELTEAMVRPEVARAFAAAPVGDAAAVTASAPVADDVQSVQRTLGMDEVIVAAIAVDAGALTYAATLRRAGCATDVVTATRADEVARRLHEAPCRSGATPDALAAEAIAHPRPAPAVAAPARAPERGRWWKKPWLWVGVVGAVGVGVVLAVSLWPRDASYSAVVDLHSFALGQR